ncbi:hypothetical protein LCGC14_3143960 [marine sediment metagenome]|uniref:Uncharacterized protein n=1 Tax=marine sediment metagenome TaxID=412755 RepID=A0A0F8Y2Z1_9ZZZZ
MAGAIFTTNVPDPAKPAEHAARHEQFGKDEMNLKGLKGEPQAIDDILTYYGTPLTYKGKFLTRST